MNSDPVPTGKQFGILYCIAQTVQYPEEITENFTHFNGHILKPILYGAACDSGTFISVEAPMCCGILDSTARKFSVFQIEIIKESVCIRLLISCRQSYF
jgi:hypothetical protein